MIDSSYEAVDVMEKAIKDYDMDAFKEVFQFLLDVKESMGNFAINRYFLKGGDHE